MINNLFQIGILFILLLFSSVTYAYKVEETSTLDDVFLALKKGRTANIQGSEYIWKDGVIYKIRNGVLHRTRGIKEIVIASVSPIVSTTISTPVDCEHPSARLIKELKLINKAIKLLPGARFEYSIKGNGSIDPSCLSALMTSVENSLSNAAERQSLTRAKQAYIPIEALGNNTFVVQLLRIE